jgi:outer membrane lipoprotein SlyB
MNILTTPKVALLAGVLSLSTLGACSEPYHNGYASDSPRVNGAVVSQENRRSGRICSTCGIVRSITAVNRGGRSSGVGAVVGAIVGGVVGHQIGGGTGQDLATAAGAVGGAVAGNKIESNRNSDQVYEVRIEMEDGSDRLITVADASALYRGTAVTVQGNEISVR